MFHQKSKSARSWSTQILLLSFLPQLGAHDVVRQGNLPASDSLGADFDSSHHHSELSVSFQSNVRSTLEALTTQCSTYKLEQANGVKPSSTIKSHCSPLNTISRRLFFFPIHHEVLYDLLRGFRSIGDRC
jgi:hypothetical protein